MVRICTLPALLLLGACATTVPQSTPPPPQRQSPVNVPPTRPAAPPQSSNPLAPRIMTLAGLEGVIGADANGITRLFGQPRLDVREGDARKLQFSGNACVLDVFIYPVQGRSEPVATWVEARRSSDGLDVDRASCVSALKQR